MARARRHAHAPALLALRRFGLVLPGAHPKAPWPGHLDLAVKDKTFASLSLEHEPLRVGVKLPRSAALALTMPNVEPTAYGLGKSGWVTASFADDDEPPVGLLSSWLEESYRAQAPKTLVKQLDASRASAPKVGVPKRHRAKPPSKSTHQST